MQIFDLNDEQRILAESIRDVFRNFAPSAKQWTPELATLQNTIRTAFYDLGLETLMVPEALEGAGLGATEAVAVARQVGLSCLGAPVRETVWSTSLIAAIAPERLTAVTDARGWVVAADVVDSSAKFSDGLIRLSGIGFAEHARWILALLRGKNSQRIQRVALIDSDAGLNIQGRRSVDPQYPIYDLFISPDELQNNVIVDLSDHHNETISHHIQLWSLLSAAESAGAAEKTRLLTIEYLKQRQQFGVVIGTHQALKHIAADDYMHSANMELATQYAAQAWDHDSPDTEEAISTAVVAAKMARKVIENSLQLHGGIGFTWELGIHYWLKRSIYLATARHTELDHCEVLLEGIIN